MSRVNADVEALKALRDALLTFAGHQSDALQSAQAEIQSTLGQLDDAAHYWRAELDRRQDALYACYRRAEAAAYDGYYIDCSGDEYEVNAAQEQLSTIRAWQHHVDEVAAQYEREASRLGDLLHHDIPRARAYLADRIAALEAYYAAGVFTTAVSLAGAGVLGIMGGVIDAVRRNTGALNRVQGPLGEQIAAQVLSEKFGLQEVPFDQPAHGFDRVFTAPGMPIVVLESKVSRSGELHLGQTKSGEQGSPDWVAATADHMADPSSAQWSPANQHIAAVIHDLGPANIPVFTVVVNPTTNTAAIYARQTDGSWQPLDRDP